MLGSIYHAKRNGIEEVFELPKLNTHLKLRDETSTRSFVPFAATWKINTTGFLLGCSEYQLFHFSSPHRPLFLVAVDKRARLRTWESKQVKRRGRASNRLK